MVWVQTGGWTPDCTSTLTLVHSVHRNLRGLTVNTQTHTHTPSVLCNLSPANTNQGYPLTHTSTHPILHGGTMKGGKPLHTLFTFTHFLLFLCSESKTFRITNTKGHFWVFHFLPLLTFHPFCHLVCHFSSNLFLKIFSVLNQDSSLCLSAHTWHWNTQHRQVSCCFCH